MRFCPNCGTQLPDDAAFCTNCGTRFESQPQQAPANNQYGYQAPQAQQKPKKSPLEFIKKMPKKKLIILGSAILTGIIVLILALTLLTGPKAVARKAAKAYMKGNAKQYVNCLPEFWFDDKDDKKDYIEDLQDSWDDDDDYKKVKVEKVVVQKLTKDEREDWEDYAEDMEDYDDNFNAKKLNIRSIKYVTVLVSYVDEDGCPDTETFTYYIGKYKGKWSVLPTGLYH